MSIIYKGGDSDLIFEYLSGSQIQFRKNNDDNWEDLTMTYKEASDVYRVSNVNYQFRVKPEEVITKVYMHYNSLESLVQKGDFYRKIPSNMMFDTPNNMQKHLEFTFTNGKLTSVEMKEAHK